MIVCCGEALVDFLPDKTAAGAPAFVAKPGGAPLNVAVAIAPLGVSAGVFCRISSDRLRTPLHRKLNRRGVDVRIERLVEMSDIVRLSRADLASLAPGEAFAAVAARWLERGAKLIVLTKGADGAEGRSRSASVEVSPPSITPVDTIGAGDAFSGALLAHLEGRGALSKARLAELDGREIRDALAFAANAAAVSVSRAGADPPWLRELV